MLTHITTPRIAQPHMPIQTLARQNSAIVKKMMMLHRFTRLHFTCLRFENTPITPHYTAPFWIKVDIFVLLFGLGGAAADAGFALIGI